MHGEVALERGDQAVGQGGLDEPPVFGLGAGDAELPAGADAVEVTAELEAEQVAGAQRPHAEQGDEQAVAVQQGGVARVGGGERGGGRQGGLGVGHERFAEADEVADRHDARALVA